MATSAHSHLPEPEVRCAYCGNARDTGHTKRCSVTKFGVEESWMAPIRACAACGHGFSVHTNNPYTGGIPCDAYTDDAQTTVCPCENFTEAA